jgi:hypothetical protein
MNLVLSVVHGLEYEKVAPFFESFAAVRRDAQMHVFVCAVSPGSVKKMEAAGAVTHPFRYLNFRQRQPLLYLWPLWRRMMAGRDFAGRRALGRRVFHLFATRFIFYYDFLQAHRDEFENVFLTDCRDVWFQRNPFIDHLGPGVHCFSEARTQIIGTCAANSKMIEFTFGSKVMAEMADDPVSCAGTTMGDAEGIMGYLKAIVETIAAARKLFGGSDQGAHNFLVHYKLLPLLQLHDNYSSSVFTAGCEPEEAIRWNASNEIIRDDGKPYPVLHQYDRSMAVKKRLHAKAGLPG